MMWHFIQISQMGMKIIYTTLQIIHNVIMYTNSTFISHHVLCCDCVVLCACIIRFCYYVIDFITRCMCYVFFCAPCLFRVLAVFVQMVGLGGIEFREHSNVLTNISNMLLDDASIHRNCSNGYSNIYK